MADTDNAPQDNQDQPAEVVLTPVEQKAAEQGWVPKDQWQGDEDSWRPAKEFLDRGELFKKIEDQNRTIKEFKRALEDLKGHHAKTRETEYARALESLKSQKKAALEDGDADQVIKLDDQIDLVKEEQLKMRQQPVQTVASEIDPEFSSWVDKNKWYTNSEPMKAYADSLGRSLAYSGMSPTEVLKEVERKVKAEFPHKFTNPNREKAAPVEGSVNKGGRGSDSFQLSDDERRVMQRFVRTGVMTEKEYIAELKRTKEV